MKVAVFAANAHAGQKCKYTNEPYIEHPVRVMYICMAQNTPMTVLYAALLHDVLKNTKITEDELRKYLRGLFGHEDANEILNLVLQLTDIYTKEHYPYWNRRIRKSAELERLKTISPDAQSIKYADIIDNTDTLIGKDEYFTITLLDEYREQLIELKKGNSVLREQALSLIIENRSKLSSITKNK